MSSECVFVKKEPKIEPAETQENNENECDEIEPEFVTIKSEIESSVSEIRVKLEQCSDEEPETQGSETTTWHVPVAEPACATVEVKIEPLDCTVNKNQPPEVPEQLILKPIIYRANTSNNYNDVESQPLLQPIGIRRYTTEKSKKKSSSVEKPYTCDYCAMRFPNKSTLLRHIQIHTGNKPFACDVCQKKFTHPGLIKPHMRIHTGEKPYECPVCKKKFAYKHNMKQHALTHEKIKHTICTVCNKKFPKESRLKYHMKIHSNVKHFVCHVCPKKFSHKQNIIRHYSRKHPNESYEGTLTDAGVASKIWEEVQKKDIKKENKGLTDSGEVLKTWEVKKEQPPEEPEQLIVTPIIYQANTSNIYNDFELQPILLPIGNFSCTVCQKIFTTKGHAQRHMRIHTRQNHQCTLCMKNFTREDLLQRHISKQHERTYKCEECPKMFRTSSHLLQHKRSHIKNKEFFCDKCHRYFAIKANLDKHQGKSRCKRPVDEPITCHVCHKVFQKEFLLKSHLRRHTTEKPYTCDSCDISFKYKSTLIRHVQIHKGLKPFACDVCQKTFTHPGLIKPHMRIHTGEKPYECPVCKKKFSHKHNMQRHTLRHEKVKNTTCNVCNKKFPKESRLKYHMKIHSNVKHFVCHVCPKKFSHKQNIIRHYSRKHPNESYEGTLTDAGVASKVWEEVQKKEIKEENEGLTDSAEVLQTWEVNKEMHVEVEVRNSS